LMGLDRLFQDASLAGSKRFAVAALLEEPG